MVMELIHQKFRKHYSGPQQGRALCRVPGNSFSPSSWQLGSVSDILLGYFYVASYNNNNDDNNNVFSFFCGRPRPSTSHRWSLWLTHLIFSHIKLVWNVLLEIMVRALWGILEQPIGPPGTGQTEGTKSEGRIQRKCVFRRREVCIHLIICVFQHVVREPDGVHSHHSEFLDFLQSLLVIFCHHFSLPLCPSFLPSFSLLSEVLYLFHGPSKHLTVSVFPHYSPIVILSRPLCLSHQATFSLPVWTISCSVHVRKKTFCCSVTITLLLILSHTDDAT